jgi:hypothetical protein
MKRVQLARFAATSKRLQELELRMVRAFVRLRQTNMHKAIRVNHRWLRWASGRMQQWAI